MVLSDNTNSINNSIDIYIYIYIYIYMYSSYVCRYGVNSQRYFYDFDFSLQRLHNVLHIHYPASVSFRIQTLLYNTADLHVYLD